VNKQVHEGIAGSQAGFGLIQIAVSFLLVTTGLLGLVGSIVSSQLLARSAKEVNLANIAMVSAIEEFRFACATDFSGTCHDYIAGKALAAPSGLMAGVEMNARLINDEGEVTPPIDLDGNGVIGEIVNTISDLKVAVLEVEHQVLDFAEVLALGIGDLGPDEGRGREHAWFLQTGHGSPRFICSDGGGRCRGSVAPPAPPGGA